MSACKLNHGFLYSIKCLRNLAWPYFYLGAEYRRNMDRPDALHAAFAADFLYAPNTPPDAKKCIDRLSSDLAFSLFHVFHGMGYLQNEHKNRGAVPPR